MKKVDWKNKEFCNCGTVGLKESFDGECGVHFISGLPCTHREAQDVVLCNTRAKAIYHYHFLLYLSKNVLFFF